MRLEDFKIWLVECGAIIEPPTNDYEILRVRTCHGVHVAYRKDNGKETWPAALSILRESARAKKRQSLSPNLKDRIKLRYTIDAIIERDGCECWFSGEKFFGNGDERITVEHLCPVSHGGPNHLSNLVIATREWNQKAGNLSVSEKVKLREAARRAHD
jgi:hypothetical protein